MKKTIIILAVLLALILAVELVYILNRGTDVPQKPSAGDMIPTDSGIQPNDNPDIVPDDTKTTQTTDAVTMPSDTEPAGSTDMPVDTNPVETQSGELDEDELPPIPI